MSFRPPSLFSPIGAGVQSALDYELAAEKADALGRIGRKVEVALEALAVAQTAEASHGALEKRIDEAAELVWAFFIQREISGFRSQTDAVRRYRIPREVLIRVGVRRKPEGATAETGDT